MRHSTLLIGASLLVLSSCSSFGGSSSSSSSSSSAIASSSASSAHPQISVAAPLTNAIVTSPLTVTGEARGPWYFEASFPVRLLDGKGVEIAVTPAQAQGEWMTTEFVPFQATLLFATPITATGTLILEKDNPSGLPEHADSIRIPVRF